MSEVTIEVKAETYGIEEAEALAKEISAHLEAADALISQLTELKIGATLTTEPDRRPEETPEDEKVAADASAEITVDRRFTDGSRFTDGFEMDPWTAAMIGQALHENRRLKEKGYQQDQICKIAELMKLVAEMD